MARPQSFDISEVLYSALTVFWEKGYEATSLQDLMEATGLSKSSLYATFSNKRDLFLEAFDIYRKDRVREMNLILEHGDGRSAISAFFSKVVEDATHRSFRNGCMSTNQAIELAPADPAVRDRVCADFGLIEDALRISIARGQKDGSIRSSRDADILAQQLMVAFPGVQVLVRAGVEDAKLKESLMSILSCLD